MTNATRRWISPAEAATRLGAHPQSVYSWIATGRLPNARIGRKIVVDWLAVERDLESQIAAQIKPGSRR
jgi:excisionase family DNA binding protein